MHQEGEFVSIKTIVGFNWRLRLLSLKKKCSFAINCERQEVWYWNTNLICRFRLTQISNQLV